MSKVFSKDNILKGFMANRQLDTFQQIVPLSKHLLETYRGDTYGSKLEDRKKIVTNYYCEMFLYGNIKESTHEIYNIPMDKNSKGEYVARDFAISSENCQRAKLLSSKHQRQERVNNINGSRRAVHMKYLLNCDNEDTLYEENEECERFLRNNYKILQESIMTSDQEHNNNEISFIEICDNLSRSHFEVETSTSKIIKDRYKTPLVRHLKAFLKVRGCTILSGVKADLIGRSLEYKAKTILPRTYICSSLPQLQLLPDIEQ